MYEGSFVGDFGVKHDDFFLLVPILFENLLLNFQILLIEWFSRIKVPLRVKTDGFDIFLIDGVGMLFLHSFAGFVLHGSASDHVSEIIIKSITLKNY